MLITMKYQFVCQYLIIGSCAELLPWEEECSTHFEMWGSQNGTHLLLSQRGIHCFQSFRELAGLLQYHAAEMSFRFSQTEKVGIRFT